jgi:DNA-binding NtrC family response regulator/tetratricopeptide (TPR) repeat protein
MKLGNPTVSATLHILMGAIEARRGLLLNGIRHTRLGLQILEGTENLWLEALAENTLVAAAIMQSDIAGGIDFAQRALRKSEQSGAAAMRRATLANLGNLFYRLGEFDTAIRYFEEARSILATDGERHNAALDSIALGLLDQGRTDEAWACLEKIDKAVSDPSDWLLYGNRYSRLTRTVALLREGRLKEARAQVDNVLIMAATVGDQFLTSAGRVVRAEILQRLGTTSEFYLTLEEIVPLLESGGPNLYANYLELLIRERLKAGDVYRAERLFKRVRNIYSVLQNVPARNELDRTWSDAKRISIGDREGISNIRVDADYSSCLQNVAALLLHAGRPELVATGLVAIVEDADGVLAASAVSRGADGSVETLAAFAHPTQPADAPVVERSFAIGSARHRSVEVRLTARSNIETVAIVNAVTLLLGTVRDLERAHAEREERLTLWPLEDLPPDGEQTIVMGRLSEVMTLARRVAPTNIGVLITGESGTGKEILARAIHRYSPRADKPFVPFNCAAIPREMLESQLFGHRRGAFTGADRDNPGVIRAARDGTLLLDEIGELSPELQPKLLRFLESGEICPLGEPHPQTVDVRIIAATNANLEELVQAGRFREDLFYRLNVIPLSIPPLRERRDEIPALVHHFVARATQEFGKSRLGLAEETMEHLVLYGWPGNIRQLNNEVRRVVALADSGTTIRPSALSKEIVRASPRAARANGAPEISVALTEKLHTTLSRIEREMIKAALSSHEGKVDAAARALGISRKGLYLKRQRLGL